MAGGDAGEGDQKKRQEAVRRRPTGTRRIAFLGVRARAVTLAISHSPAAVCASAIAYVQLYPHATEHASASRARPTQRARSQGARCMIGAVPCPVVGVHCEMRYGEAAWWRAEKPAGEEQVGGEAPVPMDMSKSAYVSQAQLRQGRADRPSGKDAQNGDGNAPTYPQISPTDVRFGGRQDDEGSGGGTG
ncbi:hypothetical protein HYPSUDRAFT_215802 [Hypholoma sublateritium FD-334 SS-4]|uniref:Uncharacterized protein n=1 Tax=Hypholoma sublateritium (strain FD-334 SS-4) TaxID=945553 RepID=A0A0D2PRC6_HYPSF|nr:hypothetical protein HYPSUDRAFT_215802 [Hypholoma sublateritium FD-334 SS-4]